MQSQIAMSFIGTDRPGLVELLSGVIAEHEGNWLESRFLRLGGSFAGVALIRVPEARATELRAALDALGQQGLRIITDVSSAEPAADAARMRLTVMGHDRPGIVHEFAQALAARRISFEALNSDITSAPMTGGPLFVAEARLDLPTDQDIEELRDALEAIAAELTVEYSLEPEQ